MKYIYLSLLLGILLLIPACISFKLQNGKNAYPNEYIIKNSLIKGLNEPIDFADIKENDIIESTEMVLRVADEIIKQIVFIMI